jgi:hypothetical protein
MSCEATALVSDSMGDAKLASVGRPVSPKLSEGPLGGCDDGSAEEEAAMAKGPTKALRVRRGLSSTCAGPARSPLPVYRCQESPRLLHL